MNGTWPTTGKGPTALVAIPNDERCPMAILVQAAWQWRGVATAQPGRPMVGWSARAVLPQEMARGGPASVILVAPGLPGAWQSSSGLARTRLNRSPVGPSARRPCDSETPRSPKAARIRSYAVTVRRPAWSPMPSQPPAPARRRVPVSPPHAKGQRVPPSPRPLPGRCWRRPSAACTPADTLPYTVR